MRSNRKHGRITRSFEYGDFDRMCFDRTEAAGGCLNLATTYLSFSVWRPCTSRDILVTQELFYENTTVKCYVLYRNAYNVQGTRSPLLEMLGDTHHYAMNSVFQDTTEIGGTIRALDSSRWRGRSPGVKCKSYRPQRNPIN